MKHGASLMLFLTTAMWCGAAPGSNTKRITESATVLNEIMSAKAKEFRKTCWKKRAAWASFPI